MLIICINHAQPEHWKSLPSGALSRLTPQGRGDAQAAADELARMLETLRMPPIRVKKIFSSPAAKCLETAIEMGKALDQQTGFPANRECAIHEGLLASKGQQINVATMNEIIKAINKEFPSSEQDIDDSAYLICGHADLAAVMPNRATMDKVERKQNAAGKMEWNFDYKPTIVLLRCDPQGGWSSAQVLAAAALDRGWVSLI